MSSVNSVVNNCINVVINKNTFHIVDAPFKYDTARETVKNIAYIVENELKYQAADPNDVRRNFTAIELTKILKEKAFYITEEYNKETKTHGWFRKFVCGSSRKQNKIKADYRKISLAASLPLPKVITHMVLSYLDADSLAHYAEVNVQAKQDVEAQATHEKHANVSSLYVARAKTAGYTGNDKTEAKVYVLAKEFGYEGTDVNGARVYLKELFNEVRLLCEKENYSYRNRPLIPENFISYKKNKKSHVDCESTLRNLASLTDSELFHLFGDSREMHYFYGGYKHNTDYSPDSKKIKFFNCLSKIKNKSNNPHDVQTKEIGSAALHLAIEYNNKNILKLLLRHNANANSPYCPDDNWRLINGRTNREKNFPLHFACTARNPQNAHYESTVEILLDHGVNINARNADGKTALTLARESDMQEVVELLLRRGCIFR